MASSRRLTKPELKSAAGDARANLDLALGELSGAAAIWREVASTEPQYGPWGHYQAARPSLWQGKAEEIRADIAAIEQSGLHGPVVEARLLTTRAGLAALEGRSFEAGRLFGEGLAAWHALDLVWDEALTGLDMATVLDLSDPDVAVAVKTSREIFERLGAKPMLERLDAVVGEERVSTSAPQPTKGPLGSRVTSAA